MCIFETQAPKYCKFPLISVDPALIHEKKIANDQFDTNLFIKHKKQEL
jgi:hypothetical protein